MRRWFEKMVTSEERRCYCKHDWMEEDGIGRNVPG